MPLLLKFHGALGTVTGSCHFFKVRKTGTLCAVDCGATQGRDSKFQPADPKNLPAACRLGEIRHLLLTHAHGDHVSQLLRWVKEGFTGEIICTQETAELVKEAAEDGLRIAHENGRDLDIDVPELRKLNQMLDAGRKCVPMISMEVEPGLGLIAVPTSHILGCVGFQITANEGQGKIRVFFSGDIGPVENSGETRSLAPKRETAPESSDYIISESTYGSKPRDPITRSGEQRLRVLSETLERSFRHGGKSKVFIPAFSLQRSLDLLADIFHVINYRRGTLGLRSGIVPEIVVDSSLAKKFSEVYKRTYESSLLGKNAWLNSKSGLLSEASRQGDDKLETLLKLFPHGKAGVKSLNFTEEEEVQELSIRWGALREDTTGPCIVICSSGMTDAGSILKYLRHHLRNEAATFVLSGFVPKDTPGDVLRAIAPLPKEKRSAYSIRIHEDRKLGLAEEYIPGDEIKCGFATLSEYYSGHADGPSICRYLFSESKGRFDAVKRVFLVHGEDERRRELKELIESESERVAHNYPIRVEMPDGSSPWFDCGKDEWMAESVTTVKQSLGITLDITKEDLSRCVKSVFTDAKITNLEDGFIITLRNGNSCRATSKVKISEFGRHGLKISVETRFKNAERLEDVSRTAFRWREVLNAIGADKDKHFAGHRWCSTDQEIAEFAHQANGVIFKGKHRRNGMLVAGATALTAENREALEILLTPNTPFYVLDDRALISASRILFADKEKGLTSNSIFYVPIKCNEEPVELSRIFDFRNIESLLGCVGKDSVILAARSVAQEECAIPPPSPIEFHAAELPPATRLRDPIAETGYLSATQNQDLSLGEKVRGTVDFVFHHAKNGAFIYALCKLEGRKKAAILHRNQIGLADYDCMKGDIGDYYIHTISPDGNTVNLSLKAPAATSERLIGMIAEGMVISSETMVDLLQIEMTDFTRYLRKLGITANPDGTMPAGHELAIFNEVNNFIELGRSRQMSQHSESPANATFDQIGAELGWDFADVLAAAEQMLALPKYAEMAQAILPAGFIAKPGSAFPDEYRLLFKEACMSIGKQQQQAAASFADHAVGPNIPKSSIISLRELSLAWNVPVEKLRDQAEKQQLPASQEFVVSIQDAEALFASLKSAK